MSSKLFSIKPIQELLDEAANNKQGFRKALTATNLTTLGIGGIIGCGISGLERLALLLSRGPINSASSSRCCRSSTVTSDDGREFFSATTNDVSRAEKFMAKIKIQTAARPAHACGLGQRRAKRKLGIEVRGAGREAKLAAARISPRHSAGTCRSGWRPSFCSKSSWFI